MEAASAGAGAGVEPNVNKEEVPLVLGAKTGALLELALAVVVGGPKLKLEKAAFGCSSLQVQLALDD